MQPLWLILVFVMMAMAIYLGIAECGIWDFGCGKSDVTFGE